jgi:hypothetical protein
MPHAPGVHWLALQEHDNPEFQTGDPILFTKVQVYHSGKKE